MNDISVHLIEFQGKNGGFATSLSTMWRIELDNGSDEPHSFYSPMDNGFYSERSRAMVDADYWAGFLGCKVVEFEEVVEVSQVMVRKHTKP